MKYTVGEKSKITSISDDMILDIENNKEFTERLLVL